MVNLILNGKSYSMKKAKLFMTLGVMLMVVLTTNAQTTEYSFDPGTFEADWMPGTNAQSYYNTAGLITLTLAPAAPNANYTVTKAFNFDDYDSIDISYNIDNNLTPTREFEIIVSVSIDGGANYSPLSPSFIGVGVDSKTLTVDNPDFAPTGNSTYIKIEVLSTYSGGYLVQLNLNDLSVVGYGTTGTASIGENDLSNNLEVYSYNKSVFITANDNINADVTVYNMSGQVVYSDNTELSLSKTELDLSNLEQDSYIVKIQNEQGDFSRRIVLQ